MASPVQDIASVVVESVPDIQPHHHTQALLSRHPARTALYRTRDAIGASICEIADLPRDAEREVLHLTPI
eukprot:2183712-Rhodomonas_salina.1